MRLSPLLRTLLALWVFSLGTTLLSRTHEGFSPLFVAAFLVLAALKASLILNDYLELHCTRFWRRGFNAIVTVFLLLAYTIYLIPHVNS